MSCPARRTFSTRLEHSRDSTKTCSSQGGEGYYKRRDGVQLRTKYSDSGCGTHSSIWELWSKVSFRGKGALRNFKLHPLSFLINNYLAMVPFLSIGVFYTYGAMMWLYTWCPLVSNKIIWWSLCTQRLLFNISDFKGRRRRAGLFFCFIINTFYHQSDNTVSNMFADFTWWHVSGFRQV